MTHEKEFEQLQKISSLKCEGLSCEDCKLNIEGVSDIADEQDMGCLTSIIKAIMDGDV